MRKVLVGLAIFASACCCAAPAFGDGASNIAAAPPVVFGQQEFGNVGTGAYTQTDELCDGASYQSFWALGVTSGDAVTINWESPQSNPESAYTTLDLWPVGTTDYNLYSARTAAYSRLNPNQKGQLTYTATTTGVMPLDFAACGGNTGPYDFTASILHRLVLSLSARADSRHHRTTFTVAVHNPDGAPISSPALQATFTRLTSGRWVSPHTVAQPFRFSENWTKKTRNTWQSVKVTVSGTGYRAASARIRVKAL